MAERACKTSPLLVRRAERVVSAAVTVRASLEQMTPKTACRLYGLGAAPVMNGMVTFGDRAPGLVFTPDQVIIAVLAGDCVNAASGEMTAHYAQLTVIEGRIVGATRVPLVMKFRDAQRLVHTCAAIAELPIDRLSLAIRNHLDSTPDSPLRSRLSPEGHPPVAPHWAKIL